MTHTFSSLPDSFPLNWSYLARKGARAGELPRRGRGCFSEFLRESDPPLTEGRRPRPDSPSFGSLSFSEVIESLFNALSKGEGGRDEPGVEIPSGEGAREPGREAMWNPRGDAAPLGAGDSFGVPRFERGGWTDSVEAVEMASGRVGLFGSDMVVKGDDD